MRHLRKRQFLPWKRDDQEAKIRNSLKIYVDLGLRVKIQEFLEGFRVGFGVEMFGERFLGF